MRDRCRELGEARRLAGFREFILRLPELILRADLVVDIETNAVPLHNFAGFVAHGGEPRFDPAKCPVEAALPMGERIGRARAQRMIETFVRSEEHTSELQSLMRNSYAVF